MPDAKDVPSTSDKKESLINWTQDDTKLVVITVGATVVANVVTVIVVALAIIVARSTHLTPGATDGDWAYFWATGTAPFITLFLIAGLYRSMKRREAVKLGNFADKIIASTIAIIGIFCLFMAMMYVLSLVGLASGLS
jgi:hypothetical protein